MGTPRPWGSATLGTATAAGGAGGVEEAGTAARQEDTGVRMEGRVTDEGRGERKGQRKEKTMSDYKVLRPGATEELGSGILGEGGA